jgi:hypothetical protein
MSTHPLKHPLFLVSCGAYLLLFILKKSGIYLPFLSDYLADFLTMPVVLSIALFGIRRSRPDRRGYRFSWTFVALAVAMYAFLFEYLFPRLTERFTADSWDVLAYALGGIVFFLWMNGKSGPGQ